MQSFYTTTALRYIYDYVEGVYEWALSLSDIATILHYQESYYENMDHTGVPSHGGKVPVIQFIRIQASSDGLEYSPEEIKQVLDAEYVYLQDMD